MKFLRNANVNCRMLENEIITCSKSCETCKRHSKPIPRPVVSMPLASRMNELVAMDLKSYEDKYFLVMVDHCTRYCAADLISNKKPMTIIQSLFDKWISVFGTPSKFLFDNGGEFQNSEMRQLGEAFNIAILTTAAESPWSNGIVEKLNGVLATSVRKIMEEARCDVKTALGWAVAARNSLDNFSGFSPNQLVFGSNPMFPNVASDALPALETVSCSEIVRTNLNALHAARKKFLEIESSEKLRRALRHNVREGDGQEASMGDHVYYKRNDCNVWRGPGVVIGRDGKQVLIKHGGSIVRVHVCRLVSSQMSGENKNVQSHETSTETPVPRQLLMEDSEDDEPNIDQNDSAPVTAPPEPVVPVIPQYEVCRARVGDRITGVDKQTGEQISGKLHSRAGKVGSKHSFCWNVEKNDGSIGWYDLKKDVIDLQNVPDNEELMILFNNEDVRKAKEKEMANWNENNVYEEVEDEGQMTISTRWVITEKIKNGETITKARLVARGFEEDSSNLQKDSPTCAKESVKLAVAIAATKGWSCKSLDVKAAYLQGKQINRDIYLKPPPDYDQSCIWKLNKTVYGLCDAARAWYMRVKEQLIDIGLIMCKYDHAMFSYVVNGTLEGLICLYVDDFLYCGTSTFENEIISRVSESFQVGNSESGAFKYIGINVVTKPDNKFSLDQLNYCSTIKPLKLSSARLNNKKSELNEDERTQFRSLLGQLNWVATQTRPDIAFDVCELSGSVQKATVGDIVRLNKVISRVTSECLKIGVPRMNRIEDCVLECYTDSSFANLSGGGSQGGHIIFLKDAEGKRCPIFWKSRKIRRIVKSTLAAETLALLDGAEAAYFLGKMISDIFMIPVPPIICNTDNKSLLDALYTSKQVDDRRLRIDIAVLQDMIERGELQKVNWVSTADQLADALTKKGVPMERLKSAITC